MKRILPGLSLLGAFLFASALGASSAAGANLLANPGFESAGGSYTGWFTFGAGVQMSTPATDNIFRTGAAASKTYGGFTGCPGLPSFSVCGFGQAFTPVAGRLYTMSGYSFIAPADPIPGTTTCTKNRMIAKVVFFNAASGGAEISSSEVVIGDGNTVTNQWNAFTVSAPAPAGALRVEALFLYLQPACDAGAVYVDDTSFEETIPVAQPNVLLNPSFSSGLANWSTFGNVFAQSGAGSVRTATGSAKMFSTFSPDSPSGMFQATAAAEGNLWQLDAYTMTTCFFNDAIAGSNDNFVLGRIEFFDAGSVSLGGNDAVFLDNTAPLGKWANHQLTSVAPAGTATARAYLLFISPTLAGGSMYIDDVGFRSLGNVDVSPATLPGRIELAQNVPNPFRGSTRIDFVLPGAGSVEVDVYDVAGRRIATLFRGTMDAGPHTVSWNGRTSAGVAAATGVYRYVVKSSAGRMSRHMLLLP